MLSSKLFGRDINQGTLLQYIFLFFITLLGLALRLIPFFTTDFPINDGGLFYNMIMDLVSNDLAYPRYTSYNLDSIPFAYPPFALYLGALLVKIGVPLLLILRYIPLAISVITIPAMYRLGSKILTNQVHALFTAFIFAMTPSAFLWRIYGGGITRSFGLLFLILYFEQLYTTQERKTPNISLILWGSLSALSHPEAIMHMLLGTLSFLLVKPSRTRFFLVLSNGAIIILVTSIWWGQILFYHGISPFLSVFENNGWISQLEAILTYIFAPGFSTFLGILGLLLYLARRDFLVPIWYVAILVILPRGADQYMPILASISGAFFIGEVLIPGILQSVNRSPNPSMSDNPQDLTSYIQFKPVRDILLSVVWGLFIVSCLTMFMTPTNTLTVQERDAIQWVSENTEEDSKFLLLGTQDFINSPLLEWFPALSQRKSILAIQGYEWLPGKLFLKHIGEYEDLMSCSYKNTECLNAWSRNYKKEYDYIIIGNLPRGGNHNTLILSLIESKEHLLIYKNNTIYIFSVASYKE